MRRRVFVVFVVLVLLLLIVFPLGAVVPSQSGGSDSSSVVKSSSFTPTMIVPAGVDKDGNGVEDGLDQQIAGRVQSNIPSATGENVNVTVMLKSAPTSGDLSLFVSAGGVVTTQSWTYAVYGFGGHLPYKEIPVFAKQCSDVLLIEKEAPCNVSLAYAVVQVGVRPYVWSTLGLQGDPNSSIAVIDTGIDGSHVDFAPGFGSQDFSKKIVGWNDQVTSSSAPFDDNGHGSHCSGLAAGDGFFSVNSLGFATATWGISSTFSSSGTYYVTGMMVNNSGPINISVKWASTGSVKLSALPLYYGDKTLSGSWTNVTSVSTPSQNTWYNLTYNVASVPSGGYDMYHPLLTITGGTGNLNVVFNMSWPYVPPSDGFSALTGIAPQSRLVGVKVLDYSGGGSSTGLVNGINWVIANRVTYHITVASMSLGFGSEVTAVDSAVLNLVNSGISTTVAAGNSGSGSNTIYSPGSVDEVLTVAAVNQFDGISSFSGQGGTSRYTAQTLKPDVAAPGGSFYGAPLFSVDSNYNDAEGAFADFQANDAAPMQGTSMATPVVAGAAQVVVQALGGYNAWNYTRNQALMPKTLLLMTASETYPNLREAGTTSTSPTLDRGGKDVQEGYGRLNVDAAADAVLKSYRVGMTVSDSLGSPPTSANIAVLGQKLVWARNVQLLSGTQYNFSLTVPPGADYDLYLYNVTGTAYGEPIIVASSTTAATGGFENITYTPSLTGQYYVVVKRATETAGAGQFTLTSWPRQNVHLLLVAQPNNPTFTKGQSVTLAAEVLNQLNPTMNSTLTLTVTGPGNYYYFDFQQANVTADAVCQYRFTWSIPNISGTYLVEIGLVPAQLTAYDAAWIVVN